MDLSGLYLGVCSTAADSCSSEGRVAGFERGVGLTAC